MIDDDEKVGYCDDPADYYEVCMSSYDVAQVDCDEQ